jgi:phosphopantetheinyl transferase
MGGNYDGLVMHGNLDSLVDLNREARPPRLSLWLATPSAQSCFDPTLLTEADRERLLASRNSRRQQEFKVSRALQAFVGSRNAHSLSHSGGHAALLTTSSLLQVGQLQVGVDLEVSRPRDVLRIARFAFSNEEVAALESRSGGARDELFYTLWTMKEALAKALRLNLIDALRQCVFVRPLEDSPGESSWTGSAPTPSPWSVQVFQPRAGFFLAAACIGAGSAPSLQTWEWPPQQAASWPLIAAAAAPAGAAVLPE